MPWAAARCWATSPCPCCCTCSRELCFFVAALLPDTRPLFEGAPLSIAADARSFLHRNGHGLRPPSGRCGRERGSPPQTPPSPACFIRRPGPSALAGGPGRFTWNRKGRQREKMRGPLPARSIPWKTKAPDAKNASGAFVSKTKGTPTGWRRTSRRPGAGRCARRTGAHSPAGCGRG